MNEEAVIVREVPSQEGLKKPIEKPKSQYVLLELEDGGEVVVYLTNIKIRSLIHIPAYEANDERLTNPYPGESRPERWTVAFEYGDRYNISEDQYNKLKETISLVELSALGD